MYDVIYNIFLKSVSGTLRLYSREYGGTDIFQNEIIYCPEPTAKQSSIVITNFMAFWWNVTYDRCVCMYDQIDKKKTI